jgi:hypothetical protein
MTDNDESPTLSNVTPYEWDDEQAIDFEVAQDTIGLFIAHCTDRYWTERRSQSPDQSVMDYWDEICRGRTPAPVDYRRVTQVLHQSQPHCSAGRPGPAP